MTKNKKLPKKQKIIIGTVLAFVLLVAGVNALFLPRSSAPPAQSQQAIQNQGEQGPKTKVLIDSSPALIKMNGIPHCDSASLNKQTPYMCALPDDKGETVVTAPKETEQDGKKYRFVTWDGCSEGNVDKSICKLKFEKHQSYSLKATYEIAPVATAPATPTAPVNPCANPAVEKISNVDHRVCSLQVSKVPQEIVFDEVYLGKQPTGTSTGHLSLTCQADTSCETQYWPVQQLVVKSPAVVKLTAPQEILTKNCGIGGHICTTKEKYRFRQYALNLPAGAHHTAYAQYEYVCDVDNPGPIVWGYQGGTECKK